jgi:hypothetical protein
MGSRPPPGSKNDFFTFSSVSMVYDLQTYRLSADEINETRLILTVYANRTKGKPSAQARHFALCIRAKPLDSSRLQATAPRRICDAASLKPYNLTFPAEANIAFAEIWNPAVGILL